MNRNLQAFLTALFFFTTSISSLQAIDYELIGLSWSASNERLSRIDLTTGAVTPYATIRTTKLMGIAYSEPGDFLYGTTTHLSTPAKSLLKINRLTGALISQHSIGLQNFARIAEGDVAVQQSTGHVFCLRSGGGIVVWNPTNQTIVRSFVIPLQQDDNSTIFSDTSTLAFNAAGNLFTIIQNSQNSDPSILYKINPITGEVLDSKPLSAQLGVVGGMAFHPETDQAFVADFCIGDSDGNDLCTGSHLYLIDISTGQLDLIGPTSIGMSGITFVPVFPTPSPIPDIALAGPSGGVITDGQTTPIHFGENAFGGGTSTSYTIENAGILNPLTITGITVPPGFSIFPAQFPITLGSGSKHTFSISSTGPTQGAYSGQVHIFTNDPDEADFDFPIRALYNMPEIQIFSNFGQLTDGGTYPALSTTWGTPSRMFVNLTNINAGPLTVTGINLPTGFGYFTAAPTFPFSLNKNQFREIDLVFTGATPGNFSGMISILCNDDDEASFDILVSGTVAENSITFLGMSDTLQEGGSISANAFGANFMPPTYQWDLDSDGEFDDATGQSIQLPNSDGPGSVNVSVRITDSLSSIIRSSNVAISNRNPVTNVTAPFTTQAGIPLTLNLTATDAAPDVAAGFTWRIDWGDGTVTTTATGQPASISPSHTYTQPGQTHQILVSATDKDGGLGTSEWFSIISSSVIGVFNGADINHPELFDAYSILNFESTALGNPVSRIITIQNRSSTSATIGPFSLPAGFSLINPPSFPMTLAPLATQTLDVRFAADRYGPIEEMLSFTTTDPAMTSFELALIAQVPTPDIGVRSSSDEKTFEDGIGVWEKSASVNSSFANRVFTLSNDNSSVPLNVSGIILPMGYTLIDPPSFPLILGGPSFSSSIDINLGVDTSIARVLEGRVEILSDDPDENPFDFIVITRIGDVPDLVVLCEEHADEFINSYMDGGQAVIFSSQMTPLTFTGPSGSLRLYNQGNLPLTISTLSLPVGFVFATPLALPAVIGASSSLNLTINFTTTTPGNHVGNLIVTSTDPDENPYNVSLSATISGAPAAAPQLTALSIIQPTGGNPALFSANIAGTPLSIIILESSTDLGIIDPWATLGQITLDAAGQGQFLNIPDPGTVSPPALRNFYRLKSE